MPFWHQNLPYFFNIYEEQLCCAFRVPVIDGSVFDLTAKLNKDAAYEYYGWFVLNFSGWKYQMQLDHTTSKFIKCLLMVIYVVIR